MIIFFFHKFVHSTFQNSRDALPSLSQAHPYGLWTAWAVHQCCHAPYIPILTCHICLSHIGVPGFGRSPAVRSSVGPSGEYCLREAEFTL